MLLKIQNVGKKQKTKKKNFKTTALPALSPHSPDLLASALLVWPSLSSEPREWEEARGEGGPGDPLRSPPPLPVPGWVGCQVYLCTSCTLINLCKSPPRPCHVSVPLLIPLKLPGLLQSPPNGPGKWDGQGPPRLESAGCPSYRTLTASQPSPVFFATHQGERALPGTGKW